MAKPAPKVAAVPVGATAPRASVRRPSPEARALAFDRGASIDAMMSTLRERLLEVCHLIAQILECMPEDGMGLRTLRSKLTLTAGEIGVWGP
jgi:hypothetical protein